MSDLTKEQIVLLRTKVREVLALLPPGRRATEAMLREGIAQLVPFEVTELAISAAIEANQERGYVDFKYDADFERDEFFITERGRAKDGR